MYIRMYMEQMSDNLCTYVRTYVCLSSCSSSGQHLLVGAENGVVRVHPLSAAEDEEPTFTPECFKSFWSFSVHDNHYGHVTHVCSSHDDKFVISSGNDGNIFVFKAKLEVEKKPAVGAQGDIKVRLLYVHTIYVRTFTYSILY